MKTWSRIALLVALLAALLLCTTTVVA